MRETIYRPALRISVFLLITVSAVESSAQATKCVAQLRKAGDANEDLSFDTSDLVQILAAGKYNSNRPATWAEGDWNADGVFSTSDLVDAFATGNFERGPYAMVAQGPPPSRRGGAPAVWLPGQAFLPSARRLLIFGGMDPITGDTFTFSPKDGWQVRTNDSAPASRCHHTLVNNGANGAIMFGGFSRERRFNDTFRFDPATSNWIELKTTGPVPAARCLHAAAWIPSTNEMFVYGGIRGSGGFPSNYFLDTSILNLNSNRWELLQDNSAPGARSGALAVYSSSEDAILLWGGFQLRGPLTEHFEGYLTELWRFDRQQNKWETVSVTGDVPVGREDPTSFWDDTNSRLYVFHGRNKLLQDELLQDAYVLHLRERRWERLSIRGDKPGPRWRASATLDPQTQTGWMFGGWEDFGTVSFNETWKFDLESRSWMEVCVSTDAN